MALSNLKRKQIFLLKKDSLVLSGLTVVANQILLSLLDGVWEKPQQKVCEVREWKMLYFQVHQINHQRILPK